MMAQDKSITGTVVDSQNEPLPGTSVVVKGKTTGTITDVNGKFTIKVSENDILVFSSIGYVSQEIAVVGKSVINATMSDDVKEISEIVVIGYGVQKKSDVTGAVTSVKASDISNMPVSRVDEALQGKAAGVMVLQNSGQPGAEPKIRVRGLGTINGGSPLVVIDGVSGGSLSNLNPNDIESMEILKDAASQAIYGSAGANGVIIVNTKRGKAGSMQTNFDMFVGVQNAWNRVDVADGQEYAAIFNKAQVDNKLDPYFPTNAAGRYISPLAIESAKGELQSTDWQNEIFRRAMMSSYNLSLSGGNEKSTYLFSLGYNTQEGIVKRTYNDRYTMTLNSDHNVTKHIKIGESLNLVRTESSSQGEGNEYNSPLSTAIQMLPIVPVYAIDSLGNTTSNYAYKGSDKSSNVLNPLAQIAYNNNKNVSNSVSGNTYLNIEFIKGLSFRSVLGFNYSNNLYNSFTPTYTIGSDNDRSASQSLAINKYAENHGTYQGWQWSNVLNYNTTFFEKNTVSLMVGTESGYGSVYSMNSTVTNLYNNDVSMRNFNGITSDKAINSGAEVVSKGYSYFSRVIYDYDGLLSIQGNVRQDNSSKFGPKNRKGTFYSGSVGFKFSELEFIKNLDIMNLGKIRIGYGSTGNSSIPNYAYINTYSVRPINGYSFDGINTTSGAALLTAGNDGVSWEDVISKGIGFDFNFLKNKLSFSFDYFSRTNKNMLLRKSVVYTAGYIVTAPYQELGSGDLDTRPMVNYGKLDNKGFEFVVSYKDKVGDLDYDFSFNLTKAKTKVSDIGDPLYGGNGRGLSNVCRTINGGPVSAFYGYKIEKIYTEEDLTWYKDPKFGTWKAVIADPNGATTVKGKNVNGEDITIRTTQPNAKAGDYKFVDVNGDGTINEQDITKIGDPNPVFTYGFSANLEYKNFDLSLFFQGSYGNDIFNMMKVNLYDYNNGGLNWSPDMINSYTPAVWSKSDKTVYPTISTPAGNTNTGLPRMDANNSNSNLRASNFYVEDGSYLRLKNIQIGYTLPNSVTTKMGIQKLRVYAGAKNLLTFTKYTGFDPEVGEAVGSSGSAAMLERGFDRGTYPQAKMFLVGLNLTF
jgi:TonB-linked SusC/RagA family outer membrane protein